ncbi:hypothetical protein KIPB_016902, partial [Kipferlia bialata]
QKAALELVRQYTEVPAVGTDDVAEAEYEVSVAELSLKRPKLTKAEKKQLSRQLATLQQKVCDLKRHESVRHRLAIEMGGHLIFPEVAAALSLPVEP